MRAGDRSWENVAERTVREIAKTTMKIRNNNNAPASLTIIQYNNKDNGFITNN